MPTVLITGASTGIGEATAQYLAQKGFTVHAGIRNSSDGERLGKLHANIHPIRLDVTNPTEITAAAKALSSEPLHGIVNNAGIAVAGPLEFLTVDHMKKQFEVNFFAVHAVTAAFLPHLRKTKGRIVNMSSISGRVGFPLVGPYVSSKFALEGWSDSLRQELRPHGLKVSLVEPGRIKTPIWQKSYKANKAIEETLPSKAQELYGAKLAKMTDLVKVAETKGSEPIKVAKSVHHALVSKCPKVRYMVGLDARIEYGLSRILPARALDWLFAQFF